MTPGASPPAPPLPAAPPVPAGSEPVPALPIRAAVADAHRRRCHLPASAQRHPGALGRAANDARASRL